MPRLLNRRFLNPVLAVSGCLAIISGFFLLADLEADIIMGTHQLGGIVFAVACVAHVVLNWKPMLSTIGRRTAWGLFAVMLLFGLGIAFLPWSM